MTRAPARANERVGSETPGGPASDHRYIVPASHVVSFAEPATLAAGHPRGVNPSAKLNSSVGAAPDGVDRVGPGGQTDVLVVFGPQPTPHGLGAQVGERPRLAEVIEDQSHALEGM
jgi:hypothetical protein